MQRLTKYPYKHMRPILSQLSKTGTGDIFALRNSCGACLPDTYEVSMLLVHLTGYGQVKGENGYWRINPRPVVDNSTVRRPQLIEDAVKVLGALTHEPQPVEAIASMSGLDQDTTRTFLNFLEDLTEHGFVTTDESGEEVWLFESHPA